MLVGYNTNISYKGDVYHVQTEDSGQTNPLIVTLLYHKGAILASRKTSYAQIISDPDFGEKVRRIMLIQHKGMIKELLSGKHTGERRAEEEKEAADEEKKDDLIPESSAEISDKEVAETSNEQTEQLQEKIAEKNPLTTSLDDVLLNYIMKRGK